MTIRGLEANANPVGSTDLIKKLHTDPLNWGFLIQDEQEILDYPQRVNDFTHNAWNITDRDYNIVKGSMDGKSVKITGHKSQHGAGIIANPAGGYIGPVNAEPGGFYNKTDIVRANAFKRQHKAFTRNGRRNLHPRQAEFLLRGATHNLRNDLVGNYNPYNDVKVEITNPYTYTPYLLRKHSKKSYKRRRRN